MMEGYDSYKDSGIIWVGQTPQHWSDQKIKFLFKEKKSTPNLSLNCGSISFGRVVFKDDDSIPSSRKETYQEVLDGEFLINPLNLNYDLKSLRIARSDKNVVVSPGYMVLQLQRQSDPKFFEFLLHVFDTEHMKSLGSGVRQTISFNHLKTEQLPIPPIDEQRKIGQYLDRKTTLIDSLIEKTVRKIELLKEKRTSLINEVVTKGLNPDVEMKDSGVEWIGEIPSHWEIRKGSTLGVFSKGNGIKKDEVTSEGIPCVRYGELYTIYDHKVTQTVSFVKDDIGVPIEYGTLLMTGSGELVEDIGKCVVYSGEGQIRVGGDLIILVPSVDFNPLFLSYLMNSESIRIQREMSGRGGIIVHIYSKNFKDMKFSTPPLQEQDQIVDFLDEQTSIIDSTITNEEKRIELLKEYRQSLISEVVTGKVKVTRDE